MSRDATFFHVCSAFAVMGAVLLGGCTGDDAAADDSSRSPAADNSSRSDSRVSSTLSRYDAAVLADKPVGYWTGSADLTGRGHDGDFNGEPGEAELPNGDTAPRYDGQGQHLTIPDAPDLSPATTGALTVEAWLRPDTLQFSDVEDNEHGYVHWLGKGVDEQQEYAQRMYSLENSEDRPNRISGYAFSPEGGEGAGSQFQDKIRVGEWIHFTFVINSNTTNSEFPTGYVKVYKNGRLRDQDALDEYGVVLADGPAPLRVGTRDSKSFFEGAIGKVAVYDTELPGKRIRQHYLAMLR